jgi:hypothetical protein
MSSRVVYTSVFGGYDKLVGIGNVLVKKIVYHYILITIGMLNGSKFYLIDTYRIMSIVFL